MAQYIRTLEEPNIENSNSNRCDNAGLITPERRLRGSPPVGMWRVWWGSVQMDGVGLKKGERSHARARMSGRRSLG
jgi:hypothetical protein